MKISSSEGNLCLHVVSNAVLYDVLRLKGVVAIGIVLYCSHIFITHDFLTVIHNVLQMTLDL